jgi:hypothetical protein
MICYPPEPKSHCSSNGQFSNLQIVERGLQLRTLEKLAIFNQNRCRNINFFCCGTFIVGIYVSGLLTAKEKLDAVNAHKVPAKTILPKRSHRNVPENKVPDKKAPGNNAPVPKRS